jgi:hypothetical protein
MSSPPRGSPDVSRTFARAVRATAAVSVTLAMLAAPRASRAAVDKADETGAAPKTGEAPTAAANAPALTGAPPVDAASALARVRAAYEYGEMELVVDAARLVSEGRLHATPAERASALRYLGIGLFLTGRQ